MSALALFALFLDGLLRNGELIPKQSEVYPGRDPRAFHMDARGDLWVEDFESGLFRLDPASGRFVKQRGVGSKGTGVGVDLARERTWMLHYTQGPRLVQGGEVVHAVDLSSQENMRALMVDPDGTVWVGGWHGLVRIRESAGTWSVKTLTVLPVGQ